MSKAVAVSATDWPTTVIESKIPVLVDFWAEWCQPCRRLAPTLDELAEEYEGRVLIAKVNVDQERTLAGLYRIMGIPALLFFKDGQKVAELAGQLPKKTIAAELDKLL